MKKIIKSVLLIMMFVCLTACSSGKKAMDPTTFETTIKEKGYHTYSATANYEGVTIGYVAMSEDMMYQLEYYETNDAAGASSLFEKIYGTATSYKESNDPEETVEDKVSKKYTLTTSDSYIVLSRIDNTLIYVNAAVSQKEKIDAILEELGY